MPKDIQAHTILERLGGKKMLASMIGAHTFIKSSTVLGFHFTANAREGINFVRVRLTPTDDYSLEFWKIEDGSMELISIMDYISYHLLEDTIERTTGLYLSM